jgi:hypothetical protein
MEIPIKQKLEQTFISFSSSFHFLSVHFLSLPLFNFYSFPFFSILFFYSFLFFSFLFFHFLSFLYFSFPFIFFSLCFFFFSFLSIFGSAWEQHTLRISALKPQETWWGWWDSLWHADWLRRWSHWATIVRSVVPSPSLAPNSFRSLIPAVVCLHQVSNVGYSLVPCG